MTPNDDLSRARRTYTREDRPLPFDELPDSFLHDFLNEWMALEDQLKALQDTKKAMLARVRLRSGKHQAEALRVTMHYAAMNDRKRVEKLLHNDIARRYLETLGYVLPMAPTIKAETVGTADAA